MILLNCFPKNCIDLLWRNGFFEFKCWVRFYSIGVLLVMGLSLYGCVNTPQRRLSDLNSELNFLSQRSQSYYISQMEVQNRKKAVLTEFHDLVRNEKPIISEREKLFKANAKTTLASNSFPGTGPKSEELPSIEDQNTYKEFSRQFDQGYAYYNQGEYEAAAAGFLEAFKLTSEPTLRAKCMYWMGGCYFQTREWNKAIYFFNQIIDSYPNDEIIPRAMLKKGYSHLYNGELTKGKDTLYRLIQDHPQSSELPLAQERLRELGESI